MARDNGLERERSDLAKADHDIAEGEGRIARQQEIVEQLRAAQLDLIQAEALLDNLRTMLSTWKEHRALILKRISSLETKPTSLWILPPAAEKPRG